MDKNEVLAMYDVRGIQNYIFRTSKLKHAIGASAIVETIIEDALNDAVNRYKGEGITADLNWEKKEYLGENKDVQVLYIGGGNAYVIFRDKNLYLDITRKMSKYVLEKTYSLQLASTFINKSEDYQKDYTELNRQMTKVKANMPESKPVGALPVMKIELATGLPVEKDNDVSMETRLKLVAEEKKRRRIFSANKKFDNFIEEKGKDSTLAVVHLDGNNMGLRIRALIENCHTYHEAVNKMRDISYRINHSYKDAFNSMKDIFNEKEQYVILPVLTAGDDITYVCSGKAALASVEHFVNTIKDKSMVDDAQDSEQYKFSVCGGIAFIRSHFPFSVGYEVAEACCESAKDRAKNNVKENGLVGNFFDFQFCKNIQTLDIKNIRKDEYSTPSGESLLTRPFEIAGDPEKYYSYDKLKAYLDVFANLGEDKQKGSDSKALPRSFAKTLRNTYPLGKAQVGSFISFLESRSWKLPDGDFNPYIEKNNIAKYYDALELMDTYDDISNIISAKEAPNENI